MTIDKPGNVFPYIRGTNKLYGADENGGFWGENGYNCIEAGYLIMDDSGTNILEVIEITPCADVFGIGSILGSSPNMVTFDCVGDSYMRIFSRDQPVYGGSLKWESERIPLSEMRVIAGIPDLNFINERLTNKEVQNEE